MTLNVPENLGSTENPNPNQELINELIRYGIKEKDITPDFLERFSAWRKTESYTRWQETNERLDRLGTDITLTIAEFEEKFETASEDQTEVEEATSTSEVSVPGEVIESTQDWLAKKAEATVDAKAA